MPEAESRWWTVLPANQAAFIVGAAPERIRESLDPLPDRAPAVIFLWPSAIQPFSKQVHWLLDEMDQVALRLLDRWLPAADQLPDASPMSLAAVEALARQLADQSPHLRTFVVDLARRSLAARFGASQPRTHNFSAEARAAGLVRVLATAYGRDSLAVLIDVPEGLAKHQQRALAATSIWLCQHSAASVWLAGAPLDQVDTILLVPTALRVAADWMVSENDEPLATEPVIVFPAIAGQPRADSEAELTLDEELRRHSWSAERHWNHPFSVPGTTDSYRFDLFWPTERLIVEVDGNDHRAKAKYSANRVRDVTLVLLGYQVVRFTNDLVLGHVTTVAEQIKQILFMQQERHRTAQEA